MYVDEIVPFDTVWYVDRTLQRFSGEVFVVVERYVITRKTVMSTRQSDALETIGALRYVAQRSLATFELQNTSDRLKVRPEVLRHLGWYNPTADDHAIAAAQHCYIALVRHHPDHPMVLKSYDMIDESNKN